MISAGQAIDLLMEGNRRFRVTSSLHPRCDATRRLSTAYKQEPFAAVFCCSDSRVSPEIIFDQGLGDLFVIRVAGNVVCETVIGSIEYAAGHLNVPLIVLLGHSDCGAVKAALQEPENQDVCSSHKIISSIRYSSLSAGGVDRTADSIARIHAKKMSEKLRGAGSMVISKGLADGTLRIEPMFYNVKTGVVSKLD